MRWNVTKTKANKTHRAKLLKRDTTVAVLVCVDDGLVHNLHEWVYRGETGFGNAVCNEEVVRCAPLHFPTYLLELTVLQVVSNHQLENVEELAVGNVAILVDIVYFEGDCNSEGGKGQSRLTGKQRFIFRYNLQSRIEGCQLTLQLLLAVTLHTEKRDALDKLCNERSVCKSKK